MSEEKRLSEGRPTSVDLPSEEASSVEKRPLPAASSETGSAAGSATWEEVAAKHQEALSDATAAQTTAMQSSGAPVVPPGARLPASAAPASVASASTTAVKPTTTVSPAAAAGRNQPANQSANPVAQPPASRPSQPPASPSNQPSATPSNQPPPVVEMPENSRSWSDRIAALFAWVNFNEVRRESPSWLVSLTVHLVLLGLLALWVRIQVEEPVLTIVGDYAESVNDLSDAVDMQALSMTTELVQETMITPKNLPEVEDPLAAPDPLELKPIGDTFVPITKPGQPGYAFSGRTRGTRNTLGLATGGTQGTERAVQEGLKWLKRQQMKKGKHRDLWSLSGPFRNGYGNMPYNLEAATAMALLAFQGNGHTHLSDTEYSDVVDKAWRRLLPRLSKEGRFYPANADRSHRLYTQAICTIAICELYGMTRDEALREPAQRAIDFCVSIQTPVVLDGSYGTRGGGWRYDPGSDSDTSVTGWYLMAMQSARMAGIEVPSKVFTNINRYLDSVARENGVKYSYTSGDGASPTMTAEGLLCRQYLGWKRDDRRLHQGVEFLLEDGNMVHNHQRGRNVYHWYYATQVCHHMEGHYWHRWNRVLRTVLPKAQETKGKDRGSWSPLGDRWSEQGGGRLFTTCLSIYMLEVYYRHLPIYSKHSVGGQ